MQSLSKTMGREVTMGNSAYKRHIEAAGTSAFPLTKLDEESERVGYLNSRIFTTAQTP